MVAYALSSKTLSVPMKLFTKNRLRLCDQLAGKVSRKAFILLQAGNDTYRGFTSDAENAFRQESNFHWCFGAIEPDFYGAIHVKTCKSILFVPKHPPDYEIWCGVIHNLEHFKNKYEVDEVHYVCDMLSVLKASADELLLLKGLNTDSNRITEPAYFKGIDSFKQNLDLLYPALSELRVFKTPEEIEVIKYANKISSQAHKAVMQSMRPGLFEYQLESLFQHHTYSKGGARHVCYTCIAASGSNASILHYGHAGEPNSKLIKDGDMCMFDMGAEYYCYCSDISCSFPANGKFTPDQAAIYNAVLKANRAVMDAAKPGVMWTEMHVLAERVLLTDLKAMNLVTGDVDEMLSARVGAVFMPHGLGHFLGVDVHDVHGYPEDGPKRPSEAGLSSLRTARELKAGMVLTVEPGCYFISKLLNDAFLDDNRAKFLNRDKLRDFFGFGGVRIEDNVVITETGCELLTEVPRTVEEIEAEMKKTNLKVEF